MLPLFLFMKDSTPSERNIWTIPGIYGTLEQGLILQLLYLVLFPYHENVRKFGVPAGTVPVFFPGRDKHNVTNGHDLLSFLSGHDALSRSDDQDLFIFMGMKFISDTFPEIYDVHLIFFAFRQQHLSCHLSTGKD